MQQPSDRVRSIEISRFGVNFLYSVTARAAETGCQTLVVFGSAECAGPQELPLCGAAMRSLKAASYAHATLEVIDGANHGYEGRELELFEVIRSWLDVHFVNPVPVRLVISHT